MKICSLLPSGTEIVYALGLGDHLVGVSDLCDYPLKAKHKPVISRSRIDTAVLSSTEVEAVMRSLLAKGESPFHIEVASLHRDPPALVLTQDTCAICDAAADDVQRALDGIQHGLNCLSSVLVPWRRFLRASPPSVLPLAYRTALAPSSPRLRPEFVMWPRQPPKLATGPA